jgi:putative ABC transport system permease protein
MNKDNSKPPQWAERFLEWYCKPSLLEDLQGDLNEYFDRNVKAKGLRRARFIYIVDVLKFLRLYTIRKPEFINLLTQSIMIASYVKTSGRSIMRNKLFSFINIAGLAVSMSVGLLMIGMIYDSMSYDRFHEKHARIYRVISRYEYRGQKDNDFYATTSLRAAKLIKESVAGPEDVAIIRRDFSGDFAAGEKTIPLEGITANASFFNVFTFPLLYGDPSKVLKDPFSVVLTEQTAKKLFGSADVTGKQIMLRDRSYIVSGVMKDVPTFSHMKFDMVASLATLDITQKDDAGVMKWDRIWDTYAYLLMPGDGDLALLQTNLADLSTREDRTAVDVHIELDLQPLTDIITGENLSNQFGPTIGGTTIKILGSLAFVVILAACFNYTNLSVARGFKRLREVGVRKTMGAHRFQVIGQFTVESVVISMVAMVVAFLLFVLIKPHFINIEPTLQQLLHLNLSPTIFGLFVAFAIMVGIAAGLFPALIFSKLNTVQVLKNSTGKGLLKGVGARKMLVVFQYTLSIILITGTLVLHQQYKHFMAFDLGFDTENVLNLRLQGNKAKLLKDELSTLPEIKDISESSSIMSIGWYDGTFAKNPAQPLDSAWVYSNRIDENYLALHDLKLIAGRNFTPLSESTIEQEVIVNKHVLSRFNIHPDNIASAIGEIIEVDRKPLRIAGVVDDFQYGRANNRAGKEVVLRYAQNTDGFLNLKILSSDWPATYEKIQNAWKKIDPIHPMDAKFYKEQLEDAFKGLSASAKLGGFIAFLVICISSIGLFGMVVYSTESRLKEISIRKVFGAGEVRLLYLLGKGFLLLLLIAAFIGIPITYIFFDLILLPQVENHAPMQVMQMLFGVITIMAIAVLMIASQTLKVARTNPAEVLKAE